LTLLSAMLVLSGCPSSLTTDDLVVLVRAERLSLRVNETVQLTASGELAGELTELGAVTYSTSNASVAEVDANTGLVTAKGTGVATLTATTSGKTGTVELKVEGGAVHGGAISASETWRAKDNPHYVLNDVEVAGNNHPTLTIEPGVVVRFASRTGLFIGTDGPGSLKADGTQQAPIEFKADTASPTAGFWQALSFEEQTGANSVLRHAKLSHCGSDLLVAGSSNPCINITGDDIRPVIADVSIQYGRGSGIEVSYGAAFGDGSARVSVADVGGYPFIIEPEFARSLPTGGKQERNNPNAVLLSGGQVTTTQTWPLLKDGAGRNVPFVVGNYVEISGPASPELTLQPGTELRFKTLGYLDVGSTDGAGALIAEGTDTQPILFTAEASAPGKGFWSSLYFYDNRLTTTSLNHVVVDFGGGDNHITGPGAAITVVGDVNGGFIRNSILRNAGECGIRTETTGSYPDFVTDFTTGLGNTFQNNNGIAQCNP
jgi:hypothetical protein